MKNRITVLPALALMVATIIAGCDESQPIDNPSGTVAVTGVTLVDKPTLVSIGEVLILTADVLPANATNKNVTWSSSNPEFATVSRGVVTGVAVGSATITVRTLDGGFADQCTFPVDVVGVSGVRLDSDKFFVSTAVGVRITHTVLPENATNKNVTWDSENPAIATVEWNDDNKGYYIKGISEGSTTIIVETEQGGYTATCTVDVDWLGPAAFATDKTWPVGNQIWSDAVIAAGCMKTAFNGGYYNEYDATDYQYFSDCRQNLYQDYGDLFSWNAAYEYRDRLCPNEWRVPTRVDFVNLDMALGGNGSIRFGDYTVLNRYLDYSIWGGHFSGVADSSNGGALSNQERCAEFWSQDETYQNGYRLAYCMAGEIDAQSKVGKSYGHVVRCVKNK